MEQDQDAIGVGEVALVLLHAGARHRPAQLRHERRPHQLRELEMRDVVDCRPGRLGAPAVPRSGVQQVDQRAARIAHRRDDLLHAAAGVVFDDEAGARGDIGFEVGVDPPRIAGDDLNAGVVQPPGERAAIDEEIDLEAGEQDGIQRADEQFVLADG